MSRILRLNLTLGVALIVCILLVYSGGRDLSQPNVEYMPDMAYSSAHESYSKSPVFRDGLTLQSPPAGTIARGRMPLGYEATEQDALRAGRELSSTIDLTDAAVLHRGADVYGAFCQPCHGASGNGDGPIATRGYPPPPALSTEKVIGMGDGQLFHIISHGQKNMPAHAGQIAAHDRWSAIGHVRQLQLRATESSDSTGAAGS